MGKGAGGRTANAQTNSIELFSHPSQTGLPTTPSPSHPLLFFYGTLQERYGRLRDLGVIDELRFLGMGRINAKLYDLGECPGAVPSEGNYTYGEVYEAEDGGKVLPKLDEYEGIDLKSLRRGSYSRRTAGVTLEDGREILANVYFYNNSTTGLRIVRCGMWKGPTIERRLEGAVAI